MFYFVVFVIFLCFSFYEIFFNPSIKKQRKIVVFLCLFIAVLSSVRWCGNDWESYLNNFESIFKNHSLKNYGAWDFEFGYRLLVFIVTQFTNNYSIFLFVQAVIIYNLHKLSALEFTKEKYCIRTYPVTQMLVIWALYIGDIFVVRTTLAYVLLFYSVKYIINKKIWKFLVCIAIATLFHRTAIVFLPAYIIYNYCSSLKYMLFSIVGTCLLTFFSNTVILWIGNILGAGYSIRIDSHLTMGNQTSIFGIVNNIFLVIVFYWLAKYTKKESRNLYLGLWRLFATGCALLIFASSLSLEFTRFSLPYLRIQVLLIPQIIECFRKKNTILFRLLVFFGIVFYLTLRLYRVIMEYPDTYLPFKTIFN